MKMKTLFTSITLMITTIPAFALDFVNPRIVSHKEWTTGGVQGSFKKGYVINPGTVTSHSASSSVYLYPTYGYAKSSTWVSGQHISYIVNSTDKVQLYQFRVQLCADNSSQCYHYSEVVELPANSYTAKTGVSTLVIYFANPGKYHSYGLTALSGESNNIATHTGDIIINP